MLEVCPAFFSASKSKTHYPLGPVRVRIDMIKTRRSMRSKITLTEATVSDEAGTAKVVWFRQPYIAKMFKPGDRVLLTGKLEHRPWGLEIVNPGYEKVGTGAAVHSGRLVPVYPTTGGLTVKMLRALLHMASGVHFTEVYDAPGDNQRRSRAGIFGAKL